MRTEPASRWRSTRDRAPVMTSSSRVAPIRRIRSVVSSMSVCGAPVASRKVFILESARPHHERVAFETPHRMAVVIRRRHQRFGGWQRRVHRNSADHVIHFIDDEDLTRRRLDDLKRVRCGQRPRQPVGRAILSRAVLDRAILQAGDVLRVSGRAPSR
jgi:hypothetical protein